MQAVKGDITAGRQLLSHRTSGRRLQELESSTVVEELHPGIDSSQANLFELCGGEHLIEYISLCLLPMWVFCLFCGLLGTSGFAFLGLN